MLLCFVIQANFCLHYFRFVSLPVPRVCLRDGEHVVRCSRIRLENIVSRLVIFIFSRWINARRWHIRVNDPDRCAPVVDVQVKNGSCFARTCLLFNQWYLNVIIFIMCYVWRAMRSCSMAYRYNSTLENLWMPSSSDNSAGDSGNIVSVKMLGLAPSSSFLPRALRFEGWRRRGEWHEHP